MSKRDRAEERETDESVVEFVEAEVCAEPMTCPEPIREPLVPSTIVAPEPAPAPKPAQKARPGYLLVATNPYCAIDHLGRPSGACPVDPKDPRWPVPGGTIRGFIGVRRIDNGVTRPGPALQLPGAGAYQQTERRDLEWEFARDPFEVPATNYYKRQIADSVLLDATKNYEAARRLARARATTCVAEPRWF